MKAEKMPIIHKMGKRASDTYVGLGVYMQTFAPICVGFSAIYRKKQYYMHRNWKYVTCKHCLKVHEQMLKGQKCTKNGRKF